MYCYSIPRKRAQHKYPMLKWGYTLIIPIQLLRHIASNACALSDISLGSRRSHTNNLFSPSVFPLTNCVMYHTVRPHLHENTHASHSIPVKQTLVTYLWEDDKQSATTTSIEMSTYLASHSRKQFEACTFGSPVMTFLRFIYPTWQHDFVPRLCAKCDVPSVIIHQNTVHNLTRNKFNKCHQSQRQTPHNQNIHIIPIIYTY